MKRIIYFICFMLVAALGKAQGINFEKGLTWEQVKEKAKKENKYIFVDCYATWCGPCKEMDDAVYPKEEVGSFINPHFISVKLQIDSTVRDDESVRKMYATAKAFKSDYTITVLPSFLYFSPEGVPVHKSIGGKSIQDFIAAGKEALDPNKQFYTLLKKYDSKTLDPRAYPGLATQASALGERAKAFEIASNYKKDYLDKLSDEQLNTKENITFFANNLNIITSQDRIFKLSLNHLKVAYPGLEKFPDWVTSTVINKEEVDEKIYKDKTAITLSPNWKTIERTITKKYGRQYVDSIVTPAKLRFYNQTNNWAKFAETRNAFNAKHQPKKGIYGMGSDISNLNDDAWLVFLNSTDPKVLKDALQWVNLAIKTSNENDPIYFAYFDTKANLLYKLGWVQEAIATEQQAIDICKRITGSVDESYMKVITQMKAGKPTWDAKWDTK